MKYVEFLGDRNRRQRSDGMSALRQTKNKKDTNMSKPTPNSLNVTQSFNSSTTLGGRQTAIVECIRRHGPMSPKALCDAMGMKSPAGMQNQSLASLINRGLMVSVAMSDDQAERDYSRYGGNRTSKQRCFYTLTSAALRMRRSLASVEGTGNNLGVIVTDAPCIDPTT